MVERYKRDLRNRQSEIDQSKSDNEAMNKRNSLIIDELETESRFRQSQIVELESENKSLKNDIQKLESNNEAVSNEKTELESENKRLDYKLEQCRRYLYNRQSDILELQCEIRELRNKIGLQADLTGKPSHKQFFKQNSESKKSEKRNDKSKIDSLSPIAVEFDSGRNDAQKTWNTDNFSGVYYFVKKVNNRPAYKVSIENS